MKRETLADVVYDEGTKFLHDHARQISRVALRAAGIIAFAYLTALGAQIRIRLPFTPVPITGQTLFVLLSGVCLGPACGLSSQLLYVVLGILGMPFFSGGSTGLAVLLGPTGGYLMGFVVASAIMGVARSAERRMDVVAALFLATGTIYFLGTVQLALFLRTDLFKAIWFGIMPFVPGDVMKMGIAYLTWERFIRIKRLPH
jgi:biotin transport system substrate-specific component